MYDRCGGVPQVLQFDHRAQKSRDCWWGGAAHASYIDVHWMIWILVWVRFWLSILLNIFFCFFECCRYCIHLHVPCVRFAAIEPFKVSLDNWDIKVLNWIRFCWYMVSKLKPHQAWNVLHVDLRMFSQTWNVLTTLIHFFNFETVCQPSTVLSIVKHCQRSSITSQQWNRSFCLFDLPT